jgi:glycosyltransferase involved in cell wall biosynthesis
MTMPRRVLIHDFGGFAFPAQLARELARRGRETRLLYSDLDMRGGRLSRHPDDAPGFSVEAVSIGRPFAKQALLRRAGQELAYARVLEREVARFAPEVVVNTNGTMIMSRWLQRAAAARGFAYVHWMQDIHTHTVGYVLRQRFGTLGTWGQGLVRHLERGVVADAEAVIVISDDFNAQLASYGMSPQRSFTLPNWMPSDEIVPCAKDNDFSRELGLHRTFNVLYAGVLGHKHDIAPFLALARGCRDLANLRVVVVGRGFGVERLRAVQQREGLDNLVLVDWQPHERLSQVLATGDLLLSAIVPQASASSVPSKILSYLCAGRAVLAVLPGDNLGRRLVEAQGAGVGLDPGDDAGLVARLRDFHAAPDRLVPLAGRARRHAEEAFAIGPIADRFEAILEGAAKRAA